MIRVGKSCEYEYIWFRKIFRIRIYLVLKNHLNTNILNFEISSEYEYIWFWKIIRTRIYLVLKNHPNTNIIRFENICRIWIRISLFSFNNSNIIWIPNYMLTSEHTSLFTLPILPQIFFSSFRAANFTCSICVVTAKSKLWRPLQNPNSLSDQHDFHKLTSWPTWKLSQFTKIEVRAMQSYFYKTPKNQRRLNS